MKLVEVLLASRSATQAYQQSYQNAVPVKIFEQGLLSIVAQQTRQKIATMCLDWSGNTFYSRLDRYAAESRIVYSKDLNRCWARFCIAKELSHILCGDDKHFTGNILKLFDVLIDGAPLISLTDDMDDCMLEY